MPNKIFKKMGFAQINFVRHFVQLLTYIFDYQDVRKKMTESELVTWPNMVTWLKTGDDCKTQSFEQVSQPKQACNKGPIQSRPFSNCY